MPELPEVETIRRALATVLVGETLESVAVSDARWCDPQPPELIEDALTGRRIDALGRRGKYLILTCDGELHLVMHLRMTGNLLVDPPPGARYGRVSFRTAAHEVRFCDPRRFGTGMLIASDRERDRYLGERVGIEPLEDGALDGKVLRRLAAGRRAPVKAFLLDQRRVAGIGNIYADEALFAAGVHPLRPAGSLRPAQYEALARSIRAVLEHGISTGGATIDDFRHPDGVSGAFQHEFRVHLRAGEPCVRCGGAIRKLVVAGRGTYVCERCQPRPRRPRGG